MNVFELNPYVRLSQRSVLRPNVKINRRVILDYEIIFVQGGSATLGVNDKHFHLKENDVVFLRPGVSHELTMGDEAFYQPHIHFDMVYDKYSTKRRVNFKSYETLTEEERASIHKDVLADCDIPIVFTPNDIRKFYKLFFSVINIVKERDKNYIIQSKAAMLELLDYIFTQFSCYKATTETDRSLLSVIRSYIAENCTQIISLDSLAEQFSINKYTLMRNFQKCYGTTVINFYNAKRIEFAKELLQSGDLTVSEISEKLSFADIYTFSRFFKSATNLSPSEYRKKNSIS